MSAAGKIETIVAQPPHMAAPHDKIIAEEEEYEYVDTESVFCARKKRALTGYLFLTAMRACLPTSHWRPTWPLALSLVSLYAFEQELRTVRTRR